MPDQISYDLLDSSLDTDGVLRIILNDPKRRNALSEEMLRLLSRAFDEAAQNSSIKVVVLSSSVSVFCSGHDLREISSQRKQVDRGEKYFRKILSSCSDVMQKIVNCPKPVIAEVGGIATAAGCQLAASCDLIVASEEAKFCTPGVNIGLFCSTPMVALSRCISNKHAMEMLLTGDMITAKRAAEIGLVNTVVPADKLTISSSDLAKRIASKSLATLALGKSAFYKQKEMDLAEAYIYASQVMTENMMIYDAEEGINAFLEKRKPLWRDE